MSLKNLNEMLRKSPDSNVWAGISKNTNLS